MNQTQMVNWCLVGLYTGNTGGHDICRPHLLETISTLTGYFKI